MKELKEFTVERLEEFIDDSENFGSLSIASRDLKALAKISLAAKQAEPAAWLLSGGGAKNIVSFDSGNAYADPLREVTPLYTTPPLNHTEQDGWIKCSEQLPPNDDFVLIWPTPDFGVDLHVGQYMKYHKKGAGWFAQVNEQNYGIEWHPIAVTHWMKLPVAPKPESE